jgi:hypothetical protein
MPIYFHGWIYALKNHIIEKTQEVVPIVYENGTVRGLMVVFETRGLNKQSLKTWELKESRN